MNLRGLGASLAALLLCACGGAPKPSVPAEPASAAVHGTRAREVSLREEFERARKGPPVYGKEKQEQRELDEILAMLELRPRALGDRELVRAIDEELLRRSRRFVQSHLFESMRLRDPRAADVERRYGAWIAGNLQGWDPELQSVAVAALFAPRTVGASSAERWPGLDRNALAWQLIDAYRSAPPATRDQDRTHDAATFLLCTRGESGARLRRHARCRDEFIQYALETQERRDELARALALRDDPSLTAIVMRSVQAVESRDSTLQLQLIKAIEPAKRAWLAAMRALAESERGFSGDAKAAPDLVEQVLEAQRIWVHSPNDLERRGAALYLLASLDRHDRGYVAWPRFAMQFGAPIRPAELAAFLAVNPARALQFAHVVLPALAPHVSPPDAFARASLPALQRFLDASDDERGMRGGEYVVMNELFGMLCMKRRQADVRTLGVALAEYEKAHQKKMFGTLPEAWRERDCRAPKDKGPKEEPVELPAPREVPVAPRNKVQLVPTGAAKGTHQIDLKPASVTP